GANKQAGEEGGRNRWGARRRPAKTGETVYAAAGAGEASSSARPKKQASGEKYLLVDGYNVIFAWPELAELAEKNIDSARDHLLELLCNFQGYTNYFLIAVFDAYRVKGHVTEYFDYRNIHVVYTKEAETADRYIERFVHDHVGRYDITVVTSDGLEQIIVRSQGAVLWSSRDFLEEYGRTESQITGQIRERKDSMTNRPLEGILSDDGDLPET
ncbi:MAG: NYN domain-containing protein, partial [Lachnospiraceae bacterium]|nr:NYN domain-containing protein [Lachnospiraceae bacterium]